MEDKKKSSNDVKKTPIIPWQKPKCRDCGMEAPKDLSLCYECFVEYRKDDKHFQWE